MSLFILLSAFILGVLGSLHCLGMCGPLALAIPFPTQGGRRLWPLFWYYLAKSMAYGLLGGIVGLLGKAIMLMAWQQALSVIAGIFILLMAAVPALKKTRMRFLFQKQFAMLHLGLQRSPRLHYFFLLGLLNGLLPCGLVYTALATAALAGGPWSGALTMVLFGMGTTPALVLLVIFKQRLKEPLRRRLLPLSTVLSAIIGLLLIIRGLDLGVPYLSPKATEDKVQCCHR